MFKLFLHQDVENKATDGGESEPEKTSEHLNIGQILLADKKITQAQLDVALKAQSVVKAKGGDTMLGQLLLVNGSCSKEELKEALSKQSRAHLPDDSRAHGAMDRLDEVLRKSERRTQEVRSVTHTAMMAVKIQG